MVEDEVFGLHWLDYVLFAGMLVLSLGIGVYAALSDENRQQLSAPKHCHPRPLDPTQ